MTDESNHDLARLAGLRARIHELEHGGVGVAGINDQQSTSGVIAIFKQKVEGLQSAWPDDRLIAAYARASREASNYGVDLLRAELRHRNLHI